MNHFPIKNCQSCLFRFRQGDEMNGYVWKDITNPDETLPVFADTITAKILRLDSISLRKRKIHILKTKGSVSESIVKNEPPKVAAEPPKPPPKPIKNPEPAPAPRSVTPPPSVIPPPSEGSSKIRPPPTPDIMNEEKSPFTSSAAAPKPSVTPPPDILNFDDDLSPTTPSLTSSQKTPKTPNIATNLHDIDDDGSDMTTSAKSKLSRDELAAQRHGKIEDKVKTALDFKKEVDNKKEQEIADFAAAREKHEKMLVAWATTNGGKDKRNVRTLLSTMQNVLPPGTKWKPIGLGDVLDPNQVKKQYRKAMLVVHPDHCLNYEPETKFICKRIFEAINEAYDDFSKKEGV